MEHDEPTSVSDLFWAVARRLRHTSRATLAPWDVTPSQLRALGVLMRHGSARPGALAKHLGIAPRSATEVVDALEERGLVRRETDPDDRRATLVVVTDQGRELGRAVRQARAAEADRVFAGLGEHDRAELRRLLRKLVSTNPCPDTD
ncbi:MarR family winged helix-turn-helix transcriptional regulator [Actinomycetospora sp. CA-084318]|uniref:MarR family winged helix-turn-helix transcriptional regulator n=1 Tax=Actinomycetospora sp. CA-084318 TaxID=3239892 RepID=UPI003D9789DB